MTLDESILKIIETLLPQASRRELLLASYILKQEKTISLENALIMGLGIVLQTKDYDNVKYDDWYIQTFLLFPWRFILSERYPIPDLEKMNKRWRDLKAKGLIEGARKTGWKLTKTGNVLFQKLFQEYGHPVPFQQKDSKDIKKILSGIDFTSTQDIEVILDKAKKSKLFMNWRGSKLHVKPAALNEILNILGLPMGSAANIVSRKLLQYVDYGGELDRDIELAQDFRKWLLLQISYLDQWLPPTACVYFCKLKNGEIEKEKE